MPLLLTSPHDKTQSIDALKLCLSLFVMPGAVGATHGQIQQHIAQLDTWAGGLEVTARLETHPSRKRTVLTLTFDQVEVPSANH